MGTFNLIVVVFAILTSFVMAEDESRNGLQLKLVQVVFRHGDRNPIDPYPKDPYKNESYWPEGFGQLTKLGKQQQYSLGKFLRRRYTGYLSETYSPYEVYVQASDTDRTLMSAEVDLAGLYPPNAGVPWTIWNEKIPWQPIPVHTRPSNEDNTLRMEKPCPRLQKLIDDFNNGTEMEEIRKQNQELFDYLSKNSGRNVKTLKDVSYLYDSMFIESMHNYTLPNWTSTVFPVNPRNPTGQFYNLAALSFRVTTWNPEMKRLKAGPLIKELWNKFQLRAEMKNEKLDSRMKLLIYSAHDTTISSLLNALDIFNGRPPPYAAAVVMELHKDLTSGDHLVQIWFRNDSTTIPYLLQLPGCEGSCPLKKVLEITKPVVPEDWEKECASGFMGLDGLPLAALIMGAFLAVMIVISLLVTALVKSRKGMPVYPYLHLQTDDYPEDA